MTDTIDYFVKRLAALWHRFQVTISPASEMRRCYKSVFGEAPDLYHPKNLIEKIYWLQLHSDTSLWTKCADKFAMRGYVKECGFEDFLPKYLGKWDRVSDIDFDSLPREFVLKTNNGCGTIILVKDKSLINQKVIKKQLSRWLKVPFGWSGAQLHYTHIKPCIIAEEFLHQGKELNSLSPDSLIDYKIWCINGEPESIFVAYNRHDAMRINMALFDIYWHPMPQYLKNTKNDVYLDDVIIPKPSCLQEMLSMARKLAEPFPEVRVDFFVIHGKPIIGELTFTTGYGYFTDEYYLYLGNKMRI